MWQHITSIKNNMTDSGIKCSLFCKISVNQINRKNNRLHQQKNKISEMLKQNISR